MGCYDDLKGKRILVTGASRGIGEGIARAFSAAGARILLHYRSDPELAKRIASELPGEVHLFRADLTDDSELAALFTEIRRVFGGLDAAVNNAGWNHPGRPLGEIDPELYYHLTDLNIKGTLFCCLNEIRLMEGHGGSIINIGSVHQDCSVPGRTLYAASKGAIHSMTGQLAVEVGPAGIRVNNILPGCIHVGGEPPEPEGNTGIPLGRYGTPKDIAALCLFLASEESAFINGADLVIDGGVQRKLARRPLP